MSEFQMTVVMDTFNALTFFLFVVLALLQQGAADPVVNVSQGTLLGKTENFREIRFLGVNIDIDVYLGVPYAEPPKRFRPPEERQPWEGVWNATYARDGCAQPILPSSEDCLYLNVYVPENVKKDAAVMVWFHGGGYQYGFSTSRTYDPIVLVALADDMIFVSANYRLGLYGFLSTGDAVAPGNYGLMDQLEVLKWVKTNIAAFGGDPSRVTIVGESAGAGSVSAHLLSPHSKGYFNQAIMQSGNLLSPWAIDSSPNSKRSVMMARDLARRVDCPTDSTVEMLACLSLQPERTLTNQERELISDTVFNDLPFKPVVDKDFIPDHPEVLLQKGALNPGKLLMGTNQDEGTLFALRAYLRAGYLNADEAPEIPLQDLRELLLFYTYNYNNPLLHSAMEQQYLDWSVADNSTADHFKAFVAMMTDLAFACPTDAFARWAIGSDNRTIFLYHLTHVPEHSLVSLGGLGPKWLGVGHAEDLPFLFMFGLNNRRQFNQPTVDKEFGIQMAKYWINFIKTGNPDEGFSSSAEPWTPYWPPASPVYKELNPDMKNGNSLKANECQFWNSYLPQLATFTANSTDMEEDWAIEVDRWRNQDMTDWMAAFQDFKDNKSIM